MYATHDTHRVASVTELRFEMGTLIDHVNETGEIVLIQRNNEPVAVLVGVETYRDFHARHQAMKEESQTLEQTQASKDRRAPEETGDQESPETSRQSFTLQKPTIERVRDMAYWERVTLSEIGEVALNWFIDRVEAEMGEPYPEREGELRRGPRAQWRKPWAFSGTVYRRIRDEIEAEAGEEKDEEMHK